MAAVDSILNTKRLIGMDTSPFIYYFERHSTYFPVVQRIVHYVEQAEAAYLLYSAAAHSNIFTPVQNVKLWRSLV